MKKHVGFFFALLFFCFCLAAVETGADNGDLETPKSTFSSVYEIEGLTAKLFSDKRIIVVTGKVRNVTGRPLRGFAVIHFKDGNDNDIGHVETDVNDRSPFPEGKSARFEAAVNVGNAGSIQNVSVEFVEQ